MTINNYIGIPWVKGGNKTTGCDCWGLVLLVLNDVYNININKFVGAKHEGDQLSDVIDNESAQPEWLKVDNPQAGDVCVMTVRSTNRPEHVGVYIGGDKLLHSPGRHNCNVSCVSQLRIMQRLYKKLEFYRYDPKSQDCS